MEDKGEKWRGIVGELTPIKLEKWMTWYINTNTGISFDRSLEMSSNIMDKVTYLLDATKNIK